jgi:hypothetical protein
VARTRNSYIPLGVVTRGLGLVDPSTGFNRATRGLVVDYPEGVEPPSPVEDLDPIPPLSTGAEDSNGTVRLLSDDIVSLHFAHASSELFANPDREYTGYAASGFWYTDGVLDPTHVPFKATWASEGEGNPTENRGDVDRVPNRLIIALTRKEAAIFDADTLDLWMRFVVPSVSSGDGAFMGFPGTSPSHVRFVNGLLIVGTTDGVRVADFRNDEALWISSSATYGFRVQSSKGLNQRNEDDYFSGASAPVYTADRTLLSEAVTALDAETVAIPVSGNKNAKTVIAVGTGGGLTALTYKPTDSAFDAVHSPMSLSVANVWELEDDGDGDGVTPFFRDDTGAATNWLSAQVRPSDVIEIQPQGLTRTIEEVAQGVPGNKLILTPELDLATAGSGTGYIIGRSITAVKISKLGHLYLAGSNQLAVSRNFDWFEVGELYGAAGSGFTTGLDTVRLTADVDNINEIALRGTDVYLATTLGVFKATDDDLTGGRVARFIYSTEAVTEVDADFKILFGDDVDCKAISVDPETGYILVAVTGTDSVVTEINPSIERAFRFFDNVGRVKALVSYRNPKGPPDVEVS